MRRLYEYKCKKCGIFEAFIEEKDRTIGCVCPECSAWGDYIISRPYFKESIDSDRWLKNRESHMKKERKNMESFGEYK